MNSIDRNQTENNKQDLLGRTAVEKIRDLAMSAKTCFFVTSVSRSETEGARPMAVQSVDEHGNVWFLSAKDSYKNAEIEENPDVKLFFQASTNAGFLELHGRASVSTDRAKIKELWTPLAKTWFTGGEDDPRITAIKVEPTQGYYWDNKHGAAVAAVKMVVGAVLGKTMDDSIQGRVAPLHR